MNFFSHTLLSIILMILLTKAPSKHLDYGWISRFSLLHRLLLVTALSRKEPFPIYTPIEWCPQCVYVSRGMNVSVSSRTMLNVKVSVPVKHLFQRKEKVKRKWSGSVFKSILQYQYEFSGFLWKRKEGRGRQLRRGEEQELCAANEWQADLNSVVKKPVPGTFPAPGMLHPVNTYWLIKHKWPYNKMQKRHT